MNTALIRTAIVVLISISIAAAVALATAQGGATFNGVPIVLICAIWAFLVNWLVFIPASIAQSERFYDLTGSLTYLSMIGIAVLLVPNLDLRGKIAAVLVVVWAVRLGLFLFRRISRDGKDDRFDDIKTNPKRFFIAWTLQGLWVFLTAICAVTIITDTTPASIGAVGVVGILIWLLGFITEVVADAQKSRFKQDQGNQGKFIQSGLWSWSRHPNYFGEMTLWLGMAVLAVPVLGGWQWLALISPVFVFVLITYVSGVNKLERKADEKWGDDPDYQAYKSRTSILVPMPPSEN